MVFFSCLCKCDRIIVCAHVWAVGTIVWVILPGSIIRIHEYAEAARVLEQGKILYLR